MILKFDEIKNTGWAVSHSAGSSRQSSFIQFGYNVVDEPWRDDHEHLHTSSEEWYFVLRGKIRMEVRGTIVEVGPREILGVRANVPHRVIGGEGPIEQFSVRAPSIEDKLRSDSGL